jgi:hypothetical protein
MDVKGRNNAVMIEMVRKLAASLALKAASIAFASAVA